jgi:hypothetical protein
MDPVPHPIRSLDTYDTVVTTDRGAYLGLVMAGPLRDDEVSQYVERYGTPRLDRSRIYSSAPSMLKLVESDGADFRELGITLVMKISS